MSKALVLARRELASYFFSPMAYVIGAGFLAFCAGVFFFGLEALGIQAIFRSGNEASLRPLFEAMAYGMIVAGPLLTMRLVSDEYRSGTIETLMTAPVTDAQVIAGKFLGVMGFYVVLLLFTGVFLAVLGAFGEIDAGVAVMGYLGLLLLGAAFVSVGLFASTLTRYQLVAAIVGIFILTVFVSVMHMLVVYAPQPLDQVASRLNAMTYFKDFSRGVLDTRGLVYFISATLLLLYLSVKALESKRWR
jgi:ABC-2 type transport system permease protein